MANSPSRIRNAPIQQVNDLGRLACGVPMAACGSNKGDQSICWELAEAGPEGTLACSANPDGPLTFPLPRTSQEQPVADDRTLRGSQDRQRVNMAEDSEVAYWTQKWSVSREQLAEAVRSVGPMSAAVGKELKKQS